MPDEETTQQNQNNSAVEVLTAQFAQERTELKAKVSELTGQLSSEQETHTALKAQHTTLTTSYTEAQKEQEAYTALKTEHETLKTAHTAYEDKFKTQLTETLKTKGVTEETLKDKDVTQLEFLAQAMTDVGGKNEEGKNTPPGASESGLEGKNEPPKNETQTVLQQAEAEVARLWPA